MNEEYICIYNGTNAVGFYDKEDYELKNNLIESLNSKMINLEIKGRAFLQDYNNRIVKGRLGAY